MTVIPVRMTEEEVAVAATQAAAPWAFEPTPMSAEAFLGQWKDSIGHDVTVEISEGLLKATLTKPEGGKPKELCVHMDRFQHWRCGNGVLHDSQGLVYQKDSTQGHPLSLSWVTWNGKVSTWTRCADKASTPARDAEKWWKMTQEWEDDDTFVPKMIAQKMQANNGKENGQEQEHQPATRSSRRRGNRGQGQGQGQPGQGQQQWRKVVECQA